MFLKLPSHSEIWVKELRYYDELWLPMMNFDDMIIYDDLWWFIIIYDFDDLHGLWDFTIWTIYYESMKSMIWYNSSQVSHHCLYACFHEIDDVI